MPELNGLAAARRILAALPQARILILTVHDSEELVREVLAAGAQGYVLKSDAGRTLVAAIEALLEGRTYFTRKVGRMVIDGYLRNPSAAEAAGASPLSARELEIVQLLAEGKSTKEVATALGISVKTAETHRSNIMRKGGFGSLAELVRYAIRNRIIEP
ncbi:MAG: LuxR C-terminal-related transcriptional regulator, partial [Steroidobacteraceae bacterium]